MEVDWFNLFAGRLWRLLNYEHMEQAIRRAIEGGLKEGEKWEFQRANTYWAIWKNGNENPPRANGQMTMTRKANSLKSISFQSLLDSHPTGRYPIF